MNNVFDERLGRKTQETRQIENLVLRCLALKESMSAAFSKAVFTDVRTTSPPPKKNKKFDLIFF